jgi:PTS system nitrogen regulatory IIA component
MRIREILDPRRVVLDLAGSSKKEILAKLATPIAETHPRLDHDGLVKVLIEREETSTTAIADGIAIPHGKMDLGDEVICAFGRASTGVEFDSVDGNPTQLFFLLVSPEKNPSLHLRWLAHLAVLLKNPEFRQNLLGAETAKDVLAILDAEEEARTKDTSSDPQ